MTTTLQEALDRVAAEVGCPLTAVELTLRYDADDGAYFYTCRIARATERHGRRERLVRPAFEGFGPTPEAAVADVLRQVAAWRDPEAAAAERSREAQLATFRAMRAEGTLTAAQLAAIEAKLATEQKETP